MENQTILRRQKGQSILKQFDFFKQTFNFRITNGKTTRGSCCGLLCSLLFLLVIGAFIALKVDYMINKRGIKILTTHLENHLDDSFELNGSNGLNFAFALVKNRPSNPSELTEPTLIDDSIGSFIFKSHAWGIDESTG